MHTPLAFFNSPQKMSLPYNRGIGGRYEQISTNDSNRKSGTGKGIQHMHSA